MMNDRSVYRQRLSISSLSDFGVLSTDSDSDTDQDNSNNNSNNNSNSSNSGLHQHQHQHPHQHQSTIQEHIKDAVEDAVEDQKIQNNDSLLPVNSCFEANTNTDFTITIPVGSKNSCVDDDKNKNKNNGEPNKNKISSTGNETNSTRNMNMNMNRTTESTNDNCSSDDIDIDIDIHPVDDSSRSSSRSSRSSNNNNNNAVVVVEGTNDTNDTERLSNKDCDAALASELNNLSFKEREILNDEIHGIGLERDYIPHQRKEESPAMLEESLKRLAEELERLRCSGTAKAFARSQELFGSEPEKGTYINETDFRLLFLRTLRFDCTLAAKRMCVYLDHVQVLFGDKNLQRRISLSDFNEREMDSIRKGYTQLVIGRDRGGRRVYIHFASENDVVIDADNEDKSELTISRQRISTYMMMSLVEGDILTQRLGVVVIFMMHELKMDPNDFYARSKSQSSCAAVIPFRVGAAHYCFPRAEYGFLTAIVKSVVQPVRTRIRVHTGSPIECLWVLQSFGIPAVNIPLNTATGDRELSDHKKWLDLCALKEEETTNGVGTALRKRIIECPTHTDILSGRGQIVMKHPGNTMFRNVIQSGLAAYASAKNKAESTKMTWETLRILKSKYGARFLKEELVKTDGLLCWVEISNEAARSKIRIAFRDARKKQSRNAQKGMRKKPPPLEGKDSKRKNNNNDLDGEPLPIFAAATTQSLQEQQQQQQQQQEHHDLFDSVYAPSTLVTTTNNHSFDRGVYFQSTFNHTREQTSSPIPLEPQLADSSTSIFLTMNGGGSLDLDACNGGRMGSGNDFQCKRQRTYFQNPLCS